MTTGPGQPPPDEDARWREIVENYGARPEVEGIEGIEAPGDTEVTGPAAPPPPAPAPDPEDHFVPPEPPPVGWPTGPRAVACIGLFAGPALILVMLLFKVTVPTWLGWLAMFGFIGGFGYLVSSVRRPDEWDDGSQV